MRIPRTGHGWRGSQGNRRPSVVSGRSTAPRLEWLLSKSSTIHFGSSLDGRLTEITAVERSLAVVYRRAALRQLADSTLRRHVFT